jgi:outer membrane protein TolC
MIKHLAVLALALPMVIGAQTPDDPKIISLDEAIRMAQQNMPAAIQARNAVRTASMNVRGSYLDVYVPTLTSNISLDYPEPPRAQPGQPPNPRIWGHSASLNAGLGIFDYRKHWAIGQAKLGLQSAEIQEVQQRYNTSSTVKQQYFAALNAVESENAARASLRTAEESYRHAVTRVRAGAVITADSLNAMISLGTARINLLSAQNASRQASAQLTRTVGSETPVQADPADTANFEFVTVDSLALVRLVEEGPALEQQRITLETRKYAIKTARWAYLPNPLPTISWSRRGTGSGFYGYDDLPFVYSGSYTTGIQLALPIWTNLQREDALITARMQSDLANVQYRDTRAAQMVSLNQAIGTLRTSEAQIRLADLQLLAAIEQNRVIQLRYELGSETQLAASTSQDQLTAARQRVVSLRNTYRLARATLETLIGRDLQ